MKGVAGLAGAIGFSVLLAAPSYAQQAAANTPSPAPAVTQAPTGPNGSLEKYHGMWRASKLVGSSVYNEGGQSIGSIDDLLVGDDGKIDTAVLSVGGFLGIGGKLVAVPYKDFRFDESRNSTSEVARVADTSTAPLAPITQPAATMTANPAPVRTADTLAPSSARPYFSVVLPGATKHSLSAAAEFKYSG